MLFFFLGWLNNNTDLLMCAKITKIILPVNTLRLLEMDISKFAVALSFLLCSTILCVENRLVCFFFFQLLCFLILKMFVLFFFHGWDYCNCFNFSFSFSFLIKLNKTVLGIAQQSSCPGEGYFQVFLRRNSLCQRTNFSCRELLFTIPSL